MSMTIVDYLGLLADTPRVDAFRRAIDRVVEPGQTVLDLGTGVGTYAMLAARAGARVLAVEAEPAIEVARELARANGLEERINFLAGRAEEIEPPERADVLIFEDFAPALCQSGTACLLRVVAERWLRPDAVAIPRSLRLNVAPVSCPESYAPLVPWADGGPQGLAVGPLVWAALNDLHRAVWSPDVLLAEPAEALRTETLDAGDLSFSAELQWQAEREVSLHGLGAWLDLELAEGIVFSNAPSGRSTGWNQVFLPLAQPVDVGAGEVVHASVAALGGGGDGGALWWRWSVRVGGHVQDMNTFRSMPLSMERLRSARPDFRPGLTPSGAVRRAVLELAGEGLEARAIAAQLVRRFPAFIRGESAGYRAIAAELEAGHLAGDRAVRSTETVRG